MGGWLQQIWYRILHGSDDGSRYSNQLKNDNKIIWSATLDPMTGNPTDKFDIYDLSADRWSIGNLPFKMSGASVIFVNNTIYVAGGSKKLF